MISQELRKKFIQYFEKKGHQKILSSPVIPLSDPTLLFINAGMNQFKDVFLGKDQRDYTRAVSSQKCIRAGGKHNDLENVGHTARHLTFFEMLGNFSFGDYFKKEAIDFAWEVSTEIFALDPKYFWASVFETDDESFELWKKYLPENRIVRMGEKDNFWSMGDTGPCGPCTEILYDRGPGYGKATSPLEDPEGERFLEFWNLVFMESNRNASGKLTPLPNQSVDTGAGLERLAMLKMGVDNVFETDIFQAIIHSLEKICHQTYKDSLNQPAFHVIADHLRCLSFAIADGAVPSNIERGYVLRKILRRAIRYGKQLDFNAPFLGKLVPTLVEQMGSDYPELKQSERRIQEIFFEEETAFFRVLQKGGQLLQHVIKNSVAKKMISGEDAFKLKDTYGLPLEEIQLMAQDENLAVDLKTFQHLEKEAKLRSKKAHISLQQEFHSNIFETFLQKHQKTEFVGYKTLSSQGKVLAILVEGRFSQKLDENQTGSLILDRSPAYAEMGGQIGDQGIIDSKESSFEFFDTKAPAQGIITHVGKVKKGTISVGDSIEIRIQKSRRNNIAKNHTATHLLHWALVQTLGSHIRQSGSLVAEDRLRFDFNHHKAISHEELCVMEQMVNAKIRENILVDTYEIDFTEVQNRSDIKQFFGEKYQSRVRVVDLGDSKELCGGTHVTRTGDIGFFKITKESSVAAGVRRIEAVTAQAAERHVTSLEDTLRAIAEFLKTPEKKIFEKIRQQTDQLQSQLQILKQMKQSQRNTWIQKLKNEFTTIKSIHFIAKTIDVDSKDLSLVADQLLQSTPSACIVLGTIEKDRCQIVICLSKDLVEKGFNANDFIQKIAKKIDGGGGGKNHMAQAGGKNPEGLKNAYLEIENLIQSSC